MYGKQNRDFRPKGEGRSDRRPLLPKRKLNILVNLTLGKSYHSVVTFLHAQKIRWYTFSIQSSSQLISYYICPWKVGPKVFYFSLGNAERVAKYFFPASTQCPEISSFRNIFAISEQPHPWAIWIPLLFSNENRYISWFHDNNVFNNVKHF